jgi:hypothetical protein
MTQCGLDNPGRSGHIASQFSHILECSQLLTVSNYIAWDTHARTSGYLAARERISTRIDMGRVIASRIPEGL